METNKLLHIVAFSLLVIGGLNWGLIGLFDFNLINSIFGTTPSIEQLVYIVVGVSSIYVFATHQGDCKICGELMKKKK